MSGTKWQHHYLPFISKQLQFRKITTNLVQAKASFIPTTFDREIEQNKMIPMFIKSHIEWHFTFNDAT